LVVLIKENYMRLKNKALRSCLNYLSRDVWIGDDLRIKSKHRFMLYGFLVLCIAAGIFVTCSCDGKKDQDNGILKGWKNLTKHVDLRANRAFDMENAKIV